MESRAPNQASVRPSPALLEKAARATIAILDAAVKKAFVWGLLGAAIGIVASIGTHFVAHFARTNGASIGEVAVHAVSAIVVIAAATLFALYGGQVGALAGATAIEPEIGLFRVVIDEVLEDVREKHGAEVNGVPEDDVDDLILAGTRRVLGAPDSSWKGFFGFVARKVFRFVARRFESELRTAYLDEAARAGATASVRLDAVASRARSAFVDAIERGVTALLRLEFGFLVVGVFAVALLWYPVAARVATYAVR